MYPIERIKEAGNRTFATGGILASPLSLVYFEGITAKTMFIACPDGETIELLELISWEI